MHKRFPCTWNSSLFLPPPPSSAEVSYPQGLGWVSLGCKLSLRGCSDSVLAWGTVCPSWVWLFSSHLCPLKAVEWKWLWFLVVTLYNPFQSTGAMQRGSMDPVRVSRETPVGCNDQALSFFKNYFKFYFSPQASAFPNLFPGLSCELCFKDKGHSVSQWSRESMLLLNSAWCFMPLVHYLMGNMMR